MADEPKKPARTRAAAKPAAEKASSAQKPPRAATAKADAAAKPAARPRAAAKTAEGVSAAPANPTRAKKAQTASAQKPASTRAAAKKDAGEAPVKAPRTPAAAKTATPDAASAEASVAAAPRRAPARARTGQAPAVPAPAPERRRRQAPVGPVSVTARARYVRSSARKARLVCDHIRGKSVPEAKAVLAFAPRSVARDWEKLLNSAIANAENNHELIADELRVTAIYADEGPTIKRFKPRAMGRATPILKRTSHLTIELGTKE